jgi:hypothetical protein
MMARFKSNSDPIVMPPVEPTRYHEMPRNPNSHLPGAGKQQRGLLLVRIKACQTSANT